MEIKVGNFIASPYRGEYPVHEDVSAAKDAAAAYCERYKSAQVVLQVVAIVRPEIVPVWDGETVSPAAPSAPVADEPVIADAKNIAVDDDVLWHIGGVFVPAKVNIVFRDGSFRLTLPNGQWVNARRDSLSHADIRRPAAARAAAFEFGQRVRVGHDWRGKLHSVQGFMMCDETNADGEYIVAIGDGDWNRFKPDQVFPI